MNTIKLPLEGTLMHGMMYGDPEERKKQGAKFRFWNKWFVVPLYRVNILPIFGAGFIFVLLKTKGRKSGKDRYSPLEFRKKNGNIILFSSRGKYADWFINLKANPEDVRVKKGFRWFKPKVEIVDDVSDREEILKWYCRNYQTAAKAFFGYNAKVHNLDELDFSIASEFIRLVKLEF